MSRMNIEYTYQFVSFFAQKTSASEEKENQSLKCGGERIKRRRRNAYGEKDVGEKNIRN